MTGYNCISPRPPHLSPIEETVYSITWHKWQRSIRAATHSRSNQRKLITGVGKIAFFTQYWMSAFFSQEKLDIYNKKQD